MEMGADAIATGLERRGGWMPRSSGQVRASASPRDSASVGHRATLEARVTPETATSVTLATVAAALAIAAGWALRDELPLSARNGAGYALGIGGLGAMCLLLTYSVRKHLRITAGWGPIRSWFRFHMLLGIAGPVAILYHAGFRLGSLNSAIAMGCVLLVSGSGLVGRILYTRVHRGLSGHRLTLEDLRYEIDSERGGIERLAPRIAKRLAALQALVPTVPTGILPSAFRAARVAHAARRVSRECDAWLAGRGPWARSEGASDLSPVVRRRIRTQLDDYIAAVRASARFAVYERVFSLWHALHLPLCFLLFASAAAHVVAVHLY